MGEPDAIKPPYETPDAVISGGLYHYGKPFGLSGPGRFRVLARHLFKRKPVTQRFLLRITYRDYRERVDIVHFNAGLIREFLDKLLEAPNVRSVECAELLFKGRKSFGSDYDPKNFMKVLQDIP